MIGAARPAAPIPSARELAAVRVVTAAAQDAIAGQLADALFQRCDPSA
jgi:hypothetical protein